MIKVWIIISLSTFTSKIYMLGPVQDYLIKKHRLQLMLEQFLNKQWESYMSTTHLYINTLNYLWISYGILLYMSKTTHELKSFLQFHEIWLISVINSQGQWSLRIFTALRHMKEGEVTQLFYMNYDCILFNVFNLILVFFYENRIHRKTGFNWVSRRLVNIN